MSRWGHQLQHQPCLSRVNGKCPFHMVHSRILWKYARLTQDHQKKGQGSVCITTSALVLSAWIQRCTFYCSQTGSMAYLVTAIHDSKDRGEQKWEFKKNPKESEGEKKKRENWQGGRKGGKQLMVVQREQMMHYEMQREKRGSRLFY